MANGKRLILRAYFKTQCLDSLPCIPDNQRIKHKSYNNQESIISGRACRQSNEIKTKKEYGYDDVCPAVRVVICDYAPQ
jgi:hypothetical protein